MLLNYEKLFEPYTKDGHTLENSIKYLKSEADKKKIPLDIMEVALNEIFTELANGKEFSKEKCSCGCGMEKAATDLIHSIRDRMFSIDKEIQVKTIKLLQDRHNVGILGHIKKQKETKIDKVKKFFGYQNGA